MAEGFIVDEDEVEAEERARRRRERKKRRREEREEEALDEEDLDLIGELEREKTSGEQKYKRLKRGHKTDRDASPAAGVEGIFADDDEDDVVGQIRRGRPTHDEFDDFIEEDEFSDQEAVREDREVARPSRRGITGIGVSDATGLDEAALEDLREAFGDGTEYWFALEKEDQDDEQNEDENKHLDLKDVFEPSQLAEKMLTEDDNVIRFSDEPERFQIARKPYKHVTLDDEQFREEAVWISKLVWPKKRLAQNLYEPFQKAIGKVLEFMVTEDYEVPFIFQHRKDYLIHADKEPAGFDENGAPQYQVSAEKLLNQTDLWEIFDLDLKFRGLIDKRNALQRTYDNLTSTSVAPDPVFESMLPAAETMEELQDVQDYLYFQYSSQIKDLAAIDGPETNGNGVQRKKASSRNMYERVRSGKAYNLVRAFGISADAFAQNAMNQGSRNRNYTDDPTERPDDMADSLLDSDFANGAHVLKAARAMFAEEIALNPKMRKVMRMAYYTNGVIECFRTEKGLRKIDEQHPYYEFKYLRNQEFIAIAQQPELYMRMLKAEEEGLIEVKVHFHGFDNFRKRLCKEIESDNFSEVADAWNKERREILDVALQKLEKIMGRLVKENLKNECEKAILKDCRESFSDRLDRAPYKPKGMMLGTIPRVLAMSNGSGASGRDAICWAWVEEDGRVLENGKFVDLAPGDKERGFPDGKDVEAFVELVKRRNPDVIGISGFSPDTRKLYRYLLDLVDEKDLRGAEYDDEDQDRRTSDRLEVVIVNDEVARLYQTSERAKMEHPGFAPLTHYCVALAKYLQDPMKEYAALGRDLVSINFAKGQQLLPQEKVLKHLETALVDMVNLCGVDINDAIGDMSLANLLPYICGLGPRKANQLLKIVNLNGGVVNSREELVGLGVRFPAVTTKVWTNCASFLYVDYDSTEADSDYLDNTRVHPEDYDIARKMAADALEFDEEDIQAEKDENGPNAVVRKLVKDDAQDKVNDLVLEEYAEQLESSFNQRKRATLETVRAELQVPYEELRASFKFLSTDEIFTMFTGETNESLTKDMIVPISIKRIADDHIDAKLDCGIDAIVGTMELSDRFDISVKSLYSLHQTVQAKVLSLNRKQFMAEVSLREGRLKDPYRRRLDRNPGEWDDREEQLDRKELEERTDQGGRATRVIKHPLFKAFNAAQAEEYLGNQNRGDVILRPSSKGLDHLAVTWKVSDGVYQHIDVLELDKENEFALGKKLVIANRYTYSDLDELIVMHVKAMARKVDEMMLHDKFQSGSKADTGMFPLLVRILTEPLADLFLQSGG